MIDIVSAGPTGLATFNTQTERAANILGVQLGALEYEKTIGIDLRYFLSEELKFQNESFKSYIVQVLATKGINVANLIETIEALASNFNINLTPEETTAGMIAR
jgi:translation initiation factor IF-2